MSIHNSVSRCTKNFCPYGSRKLSADGIFSRDDLLRDRDRIYGHTFREQVAVMQIKEVLGAWRCPWQRAFVERVIGSIRRECLDHVIVLDEKGLRRVLASYFSYYHRSRLHLSLDKDSPDPRPVQRSEEHT